MDISSIQVKQSHSFPAPIIRNVYPKAVRTRGPTAMAAITKTTGVPNFGPLGIFGYEGAVHERIGPIEITGIPNPGQFLPLCLCHDEAEGGLPTGIDLVRNLVNHVGRLSESGPIQLPGGGRISAHVASSVAGLEVKLHDGPAAVRT